MEKKKCIKDKYGSLIPIDKIEYIDTFYVLAGGRRHDISYNTFKVLVSIFKELKIEEGESV